MRSKWIIRLLDTVVFVFCIAVACRFVEYAYRLSFGPLSLGFLILIPIFYVTYRLFGTYPASTADPSLRTWQSIRFASASILVFLLCVIGYFVISTLKPTL
jgi:hypothetical protein